MDAAEQKARQIATIGELEKAAGITDRAAFWRPYARMPGDTGPVRGIAKLQQIAAQRIRAQS